jgi:DNA-binding CsgD family transcriptional regulator
VDGLNRLVGRADELARIDKALDDLDRGWPGAIELTGEPGIGKTRLLRELRQRADARGHTTLAGSASQLEGDVPFAVFVEALDDYVHALGSRRFEFLDADARAELATVFPSLVPAAAEATTVATHHERHRSHRAVRALLEQLARGRPLVLTFDDVHWADPASVELIGSLLHRPPSAAVLIAFATRPTPRAEHLRVASERARREGSLDRVQVGPLSADEAIELVGERSPGRRHVIYEQSGGNPFYLEQLARFGARAGRSGPTATAFDGVEVPPIVGAALHEELAMLDPDARRAAEAAAVVGDPFEPELVAAAADLPERAILDRLDELLRVGLVRETDLPRRFRFRHPLVRRAVYEGTPTGWRFGAHERTSQALAARGAAAVARAPHVELSARAGDRAAVAVLREAAEAAAGRAPASAARWFGAALRLLPETAASEERVPLLAARARSLLAVGQFAQCRADLLECIEVLPSDDDTWRVPVTTACAAVERLLGLQAESHAHLVTGLAALHGPDSPDAVALMIELTVDGFHSGNFDAMQAWAGRAVKAAGKVDRPELLAAAAAVRAWAAAVAGDAADAQSYCDQAAGLVDALSEDQAARRLDGLAHLACAELYLDRYQAGERHARRALGVCRTTGQGELLTVVVAMLGGSLCIQGRPLEGASVFDEAVETARLAGNGAALAWSLFNRSFAAMVAGDLDVALETAGESLELIGDMEPGPISALAAAVRAYALLEAGDAEGSAALLIARAGGEELQLIGGGWRSRFLEVLTRALLAIGEGEGAECSVAAALACANAVGLPSAAGTARLAAAALALDRGAPSAAAEHALEAVAMLEPVAAHFDVARARELAGRALARAGERELAAEQLELAAAAFDSFGSLRWRDQAERELRRAGRHVHRRTRPGERHSGGVASLTARELEIALLVVDRRTNPEIAERLFLSQKTIETHLRNIFRKVDVSSRVELARTVERADDVARSI